jgi:hypothetical protein
MAPKPARAARSALAQIDNAILIIADNALAEAQVRLLHCPTGAVAARSHG